MQLRRGVDDTKACVLAADEAGGVFCLDTQHIVAGWKAIELFLVGREQGACFNNPGTGQPIIHASGSGSIDYRSTDGHLRGGRWGENQSGVSVGRRERGD